MDKIVKYELKPELYMEYMQGKYQTGIDLVTLITKGEWIGYTSMFMGV